MMNEDLTFLDQKLPETLDGLMAHIAQVKPRLLAAYDAYVLGRYDSGAELRFNLLDEFNYQAAARIYSDEKEITLRDLQTTASYPLLQFLLCRMVLEAKTQSLVSTLLSSNGQQSGQREKRLYAARRFFLECVSQYAEHALHNQPERLNHAAKALLGTYYLLEETVRMAVRKK